MNIHGRAMWFFEQEARSLIVRISRLRPFALLTPMVPAATVPPAAQAAIENHLIDARRNLRANIVEFLRWLLGDGRYATPAEAQSRIVFLRLRFNAVIAQFYIFADVLTQRSEHGTGVWIAGLDDFAADALSLPGGYYQAPPVICYVDRGHGGAIRRARTRLPGGDRNPVAVIRIPHERLIGSGIASSLVHETGHQAAQLLNLINPLRAVIHERQKAHGASALAWGLWERWISEIVADFWGVAKVGVASTLGLMSLVSLPKPFVFRVDLHDPHPTPWIRVKLSCAIGDALYPSPQWQALAELWESFYPLSEASAEARATIAMLQNTLSDFVAMLANYRPRTLRGKSLKEVMPLQERQPWRLASLYDAWKGSFARMRVAPPSLVFAVIGQAKADRKISPEVEGSLLADLLSYWALRSALDTSTICATQPRVRLEQPPALGRGLSMTLQ
jgi:hypothetical protein